MRIVVADDSLLMREGIARVLESSRRIQVVGFAVGCRTAHVPGSRAWIPMSRSSTSACRRRTPTRASPRPPSSPRAGPADRPPDPVPVRRTGLCPTAARPTWRAGLGYLLKERVAEPRLLARCGAPGRRGRGRRRSPGSWPSCLRKRERDPLADLTERELEVLALLSPRVDPTRPSAERLGIARQDRRDARQRDLLEARAWSPRPRTTAACWPSCTYSARRSMHATARQSETPPLALSNGACELDALSRRRGVPSGSPGAPRWRASSPTPCRHLAPLGRGSGSSHT